MLAKLYANIKCRMRDVTCLLWRWSDDDVSLEFGLIVPMYYTDASYVYIGLDAFI